MTSIVATGTNLNIGSTYKTEEKNTPIFNQIFKTAGFPHDPNCKKVYPTTLNPYTTEAQKLKYTIRYQNEGDAPAETVTLEDYLDISTLDINTLNFIESEYPYSYNIDHGTGLLTIEFNNINLPGLKQTDPDQYSYDETESYIVFEICTHPMQFDNTCIKNTVDIIFDTQPPITTNSANTCTYYDEKNVNFVYCHMDHALLSNPENISPWANSDPNSLQVLESEIKLHPNPFTDQITITGIEQVGVKISLINNAGQYITSSISTGTGNDIMKTNDLPNGLYFISYYDKRKRIIKKIAKQ